MKKLSIDHAHQLAKANNGICLSKIYTNSTAPLTWQCILGHIWETSLHNIKYGRSWCPTCSNPQLSLSDCHKYAKLQNGQCLSIIYNNNYEHLIWKCDNNHIWKAAFGDIKRGRWCQKCVFQSYKRYTINDCVALAMKKNGKCLSLDITNTKERLLWECDKNHQWRTSFEKIKSGQWCPSCVIRVSKAQKEIYLYIQNHFPKLNIILNDNKTIKPLELDIYIPELKLAIEYDGEYWHHSEWAIKDGSLDRMSRKNKMCLDKDINLIRIRERDYKNNYNILENIVKSFGSSSIIPPRYINFILGTPTP